VLDIFVDMKGTLKSNMSKTYKVKVSWTVPKKKLFTVIADSPEEAECLAEKFINTIQQHNRGNNFSYTCTANTRKYKDDLWAIRRLTKTGKVVQLIDGRWVFPDQYQSWGVAPGTITSLFNNGYLRESTENEELKVQRALGTSKIMCELVCTEKTFGGSTPEELSANADKYLMDLQKSSNYNSVRWLEIIAANPKTSETTLTSIVECDSVRGSEIAEALVENPNTSSTLLEKLLQKVKIYWAPENLIQMIENTIKERKVIK